MLEIIKYNEDEYEFPCLLVLGCFDAIHNGHRELLKKAKLQAKINGLDLGVMTFINGKSESQVFTLEERIAILEQYNVKFVLAIDYNEQFKATKPAEFLSVLEDKLNVKAYMSGKDFRFGAGAKGKSSTLKSYAEDEENGVWYMPVKEITFENEKISTTQIRGLIEEGNVSKAATLLGANFSVKGVVVNGCGRGKEILGYPTVNIAYPEQKTRLKQGVYKIYANVAGVQYTGITNFGTQPTFDSDRVILETYISGFDGDIYGSEITIEFIDYIRDIQKFDGVEQLAEQIKKDLAFAVGEDCGECDINCENKETEPEQSVQPEENKEILTEQETEIEQVIEQEEDLTVPVAEICERQNEESVSKETEAAAVELSEEISVSLYENETCENADEAENTENVDGDSEEAVCEEIESCEEQTEIPADELPEIESVEDGGFDEPYTETEYENGEQIAFASEAYNVSYEDMLERNSENEDSGEAENAEENGSDIGGEENFD